MALIQVTGYITDNLAPQTGQSGRPYVRFELLEITGSGKKRWTQYYQVWTWGYEEVDRLMKLGEDVDVCVEQGEEATVQEHLSGFPAKVYWPRLVQVFERNGLAAEITAKGVQVSW